MNLDEQKIFMVRNRGCLNGPFLDSVVEKIKALGGRDFFAEDFPEVHPSFIFGASKKLGYHKISVPTAKEGSGPYQGQGKNFKWKLMLTEERKKINEIEKLKIENATLVEKNKILKTRIETLKGENQKLSKEFNFLVEKGREFRERACESDSEARTQGGKGYRMDKSTLRSQKEGGLKQ